MHPLIHSRFSLLFAALIVSVLMIAACGDDDDGPPAGTPPGPVGEGPTPLAAIASSLTYDGLDGVYLDENGSADCPIEDVQDQPDVNSRISLGQYCLTFRSFTSTQGGTTDIENQETGALWEFQIDIEGEIWKIASKEKISDG